MQRRLPKRGFKNSPFKREYTILNLSTIEKIADAGVVTPEILLEKKIIKDMKDGIKILGTGTLSKPITVRAHAFSASATSKIQAAGGKAEVL